MQRKTPLRKCTGCQNMFSKKSLIRIVKVNEDEFYVDRTGKMNGRGAYICPSMECLEMAMKNKGLERSFQCKVPEDIYDKMKKELDSLE